MEKYCELVKVPQSVVSTGFTFYLWLLNTQTFINT